MTDEQAARRAAGADAAAQVAPMTDAAPRPAPRPRPSGAPDDDLPPAMSPGALLGLLLGAAAGAFAAVVALPALLPGLSASLLGPEPKAYWYLARSSGFVAFGLLWLSMLFGLLMTSKLSRAWPGGPAAFDLHQHTSLLGLAFGIFHALILMGDRYIQAGPAQILVPFAYVGHATLWVGMGQVALYGLALVGLSFYVKGRLGKRAWRRIHFLSFAVYALSLAHGIWSGSDGGAPWAQAIYWVSGGSLLFLTILRVLTATAGGAARPVSSRSGTGAAPPPR